MDVVNKISRVESFLIISTVLVLISSVLFKFLKIWLTFWQKDVKCELGVPLLGSHWREIFNIESWHSTVKRLYYKYPDERFVVLQEVGGRAAYLIRDPELVKQIAISDFSSFVDRIIRAHPSTDTVLGHKLTNSYNDDWRRLRNLVTPLLSGQRLKQIMVPCLDENKRELVEFLNDKMQTNGNDELIVDIMDLSTRSLIDGFSLIAFGVKTDSLRPKQNEYGFYESARSYLKHRNSMTKAMYWTILSFPRTMKFLFGKTLLPTEDNAFFITSCKEIADNRIANQINRSDFIQLLQSLREDSKTNDNKTKVFSLIDYKEIEAISQCFDFFESIITENCVITTFMAQQLAKNPDVQERLYAEFINVKNRIGENVLTYDDVNEMKYADMVIHEALRMCPIVTELKRRATKPYVLENSNGEKVDILPGDAIWLPAFTMQTDPQYYPNPTVFDPERFNDENRRSHVTGTYAPFGLGPRDCIGCKHPMYDLKIMFYYLLLKFRIELVGEKDGHNKHSVKLLRRS